MRTLMAEGCVNLLRRKSAHDAARNNQPGMDHSRNGQHWRPIFEQQRRPGFSRHCDFLAVALTAMPSRNKRIQLFRRSLPAPATDSWEYRKPVPQKVSVSMEACAPQTEAAPRNLASSVPPCAPRSEERRVG